MPKSSRFRLLFFRALCGVMQGYNGKFNPLGNITLAETITLACRLHLAYAGGSENGFAGGGRFPHRGRYAASKVLTAE